eukprot:TRINITY_DN1775_c0_g1_i7.p1 TRINITY_DN1775_c0_g1~~TRINITY_DN1775_c0_g1_i7.p1  ORF type:complete len:142 (+),score=29.32 TRINITY_DN1775_c0_g1_i7:398-823(+)
MEFGPSVLYNRMKIKNSFFQFKQQQNRIKRLIYTLCYLMDNKQSFLVQSTEHLLTNANKQMREDISNIVKKHTVPISNVIHSLLYVGTKQLISFSRSKTFSLAQPDNLLLTILFWSHFYTLELLILLEWKMFPWNWVNHML